MQNDVRNQRRMRGADRFNYRHASCLEGQRWRKYTAALAGCAIATTSIVRRSRLRRSVASVGVMMVAHRMRSMIAVRHLSHRPRRPNAVHDER